ncbi:hypothetical protein BU15DRAFT_43274, partial [Melanogaster broomeanus]
QPPPPPPYAQSGPSPSYRPEAHHPATVLHPEQPVPHRESASQRFWGALGVALLIWFLVGVLTNGAIESAHLRLEGDGVQPTPAPWDGTMYKCMSANNWTTYHDTSDSDSPQWMSAYPLSLSATFSLPVGPNASYYLLSHGSYHHGHLQVLNDTIIVEVTVSHHSSEALERVSVCKLARSVDEYGLGLFTPTHGGPLDENDRLKFEVKFIIPASRTGTVRRIKQFESVLPNFSQEIAALGDLVHFEDISLQSTNYPIEVKSITTTVGSFVTTDSAIEGLFQADRRLELVTSNAPINCFVKLLNLDHDSCNQTTALKLSTIDGAIKADIALETPSGIGGAFEVNAQTCNAPLQISYTSSPAKSTLQCNASTTNSPAGMVLHKEFDGDFELESTIFVPTVELQSW